MNENVARLSLIEFQLTWELRGLNDKLFLPPLYKPRI